jgi:hypothetical protein
MCRIDIWSRARALDGPCRSARSRHCPTCGKKNQTHSQHPTRVATHTHTADFLQNGASLVSSPQDWSRLGEDEGHRWKQVTKGRHSGHRRRGEGRGARLVDTQSAAGFLLLTVCLQPTVRGQSRVNDNVSSRLLDARDKTEKLTSYLGM